MKLFTFFISAFLFMLFAFSINMYAQNNNHQLAPGTDIIGYGYDVFGDYANQKSKKRYCLFKYDNKDTQVIGNSQYSVPSNVIVENISEHIVKTIEGSSVREYASSMSAKVGLEADAMFFSASVESSFSSSSSGSVQKFYYTYMDANTKWRISLDIRGDNINPLKPMLDPRFKQDLANMDPMTLFKTYGTHYIASAYLGGRADYTSETKITEHTNTRDVALAVKAKYKAVSANTSMSKSEKQTLKKSKTETNLRVVGGNSEYANNINNAESYRLWADGIADMPVLCDFEEGSLRPIWEFAQTRKRKAELKKAFNVLLKKHPLPEAIAASMSMKNDVFFVQSVADKSLYFNVPGYNLKGKESGNLSLWTKDNNGDLQGIDRFIKVIPTNDGKYVYLQPQHTDKVFVINNGSKKPGEKVVLWKMEPHKKVSSRYYKMIEVDGKNNTYYLESAKSGLYLTAHGKGKNITQEKPTKEDNQQWYFEKASPKQMAQPSKGMYAIENVAAGKTIDVPGYAPKQKEEQAYLQLWDHSGATDRHFYFHPTKISGRTYHYIQPMHTLAVWDIEGNSSKNGARLQLYKKTDKSNQQFYFEYAGKPRTYYIRDRHSNKCLDAWDDQLGKNGCPIQIWEKTGRDDQQWKLIERYSKWQKPPKNQNFYIKSAYSNKYWDVPGHGSETNKNGKKLQMWTLDSGSDRKFKILPTGDHPWMYIQCQNGGKFVDIVGTGGENSKKIQLWDKTGKNDQKFALEFTSPTTFVFRTKHWKTIDIYGDPAKGDGWKEKDRNLQIHRRGFYADRQFQLIYADGPKKGKPYRFKD